MAKKFDFISKFKELKKIEKLLSGIFSFDLLTKGGIPVGKFTLIYGDKSTGKSTFALRMIKQFAKTYPDREICYVDFENTFDPDWAETIIGENLETLSVATPAYAEEGIEFLQEATKENRYGLIIIDSLANIIPVLEAEASADQEFMGFIARTINKLLRRLVPNVVEAERSGRPITVILINQLRTAIQRSSYLPSATMPGGKYQEALSSLIIRFYVDKVDKKDDIPMKVEYSFVIEKNKTGGIPRVAGKYVMDLKTGEIHNDNTVLMLLKEYGLLKQEGKKYVIGDKEFNLQKEIKDELKNPEFYRQILNQVMEVFYDKV